MVSRGFSSLEEHTVIKTKPIGKLVNIQIDFFILIYSVFWLCSIQ